MSNQWLDELRNKMEGHTDDVPDGLWDNIKGELFDKDEENSIAGIPVEELNVNTRENQKLTKKMRPLIYRYAGIAAAIVIFFIVGKLLLNVNNEVKPLAKSTKVGEVNSTNANNRIVNSGTSSIASKDGKVNFGTNENILKKATQKGSFLNQNIFSKSIYQEKIKGNIGVKETEPLIGLQRHNATIQNQIPHIEADYKSINRKDEIEKLISEEDIGLQSKSIANTVKEKNQKAKTSWMLSLLTGKASSNSQQFPGYTTISGAPLRVDQVWSASGYSDDPFVKVLIANQSENVEATVRHKVPLNLGISLYYNLGKRWGIGTGLNYTKLSSELHSGSQSNYVKSEQTVHYIGIPVQINYNVIQKGKFTGYVTGGALVEKSVAGSFKTKYIVDNMVNDETKERLDSQPVQVSLNTALGVQLKLIDKIGIYAEPGIGYHFKNDGSLNTIYKEKPLNLNVKFGIRVLLD